MAQRPTLSGIAQCFVGDKTTHGGVAVTGTDSVTWYGLAALKVGDEVVCPIHGKNKIVEGNPKHPWHGIPMSYEGHKTECGSALIAEAASTVQLAAVLALSNGSAYDEQFQIKDVDGNPLGNVDYTIKAADGRVVHGSTDGSGFTARYFSNRPESIALHLGHIE